MPATWASNGTPDSRGAGVTLTLGVPPGLSVGDYLLVALTSANPIAATPPSAGWTMIAAITDTAGSREMEVWEKVATATEVGAASLDFGMGGTATSAGCAHRFVGQHATSPLSVPATVDNNPNQVDQVAPTITPAHPDCLLVCFWAGSGADVTYTVPGSMTKRFDLSGIGGSRDFAMATEPLAGGSGVPTGTRIATTPSQLGRAVTVAIRPSGTIFALAVSGSATPTGAVAGRVARKRLVGTVSPVHSLLKRALKMTRTGTVTPAGVMRRRVLKRTLSGSVTPAGGLTKRARRLFAGLITPTGQHSTIGASRITLTGSLSSSGVLTKRLYRQLTGAVTPVGVMTLRTVATKVLGGLVTPAGGLVKRARKRLVGSVGSSGTMAPRLVRALSGVITPVGVLRKRLSRRFSGAITLAGQLWRFITLKFRFAKVFGLELDQQEGTGFELAVTGTDFELDQPGGDLED